MKTQFIRMMIMARKTAGLTQEQAAERLNISVRTLAWYEQGKIPSDDMVANLMQVYGADSLGYAYLSTQSAVGMLLLPKIRALGVSSGAIQFRIMMQRAEAMYNILEEICSDDQISLSEEVQFKQCLQVLDDLISTALSLKILPKGAQKKNAVGANTTFSAKRIV